jgi:hypothetical protein
MTRPRLAGRRQIARRGQCMRANIRRCFLEDTLGQGANVQPAACIGIAAILAAFILTFATAPKAGAHDAGHPLHHADHHSKWNGEAPNARDISFA